MTATAIATQAAESSSVVISESSRRRFVELKCRDNLGSNSLGGVLALGPGLLPISIFAFDIPDTAMTPGGHAAIPAIEAIYQFGVIPGLVIFGGVATYVKVRNLIDRRRYGQYELEVNGKIIELSQVDEVDGLPELSVSALPKAIAAS